jgi:hypothetical protein
MNVAELVELAALVSAESGSLLESPVGSFAPGLDAYWAASKSRLDRWSRRLKSCRALPTESAKAPSAGGRMIVALCEEILVSEILSRVWTAALSAVDRAAGQGELEPIGRSVMVGHQDARNRVLHLIAAGKRSESARVATKLNRLRCACERWTDLLLAPLSELADVTTLAHNPARVADMADDFRDEADSVAPQRRMMFAASLKSAFPPTLGMPTLNTDLNAQLAAGVLACFDQDTVAGISLAPWLWHARVMNATAAAERWVGELLE